MNEAFILAAGFGTRLRPLTAGLPKPLVPVCGVPMLAYALAGCAAAGLRRVIVNGHWCSEALKPWEGSHEGVEVELSIERPEILGTGGGLVQVRDRLADRFVVINGDVLTDVDLKSLRDAVPPGGAALALRPHPDAQRYGVLATDETGTIVELVGLASASPQGPVTRNSHFTGIHALDRDVLDHVGDGFACIVRTAYRHLVPARLLRGFSHEGLWLDVGDPLAYLEANLAALQGGLPLSLDPMKRAAWSHHAPRGDAEINGPVWVGEAAQVGHARLDRVVIGPGASIPDDCTLEEVVVWEGCQVPPGPLKQAVVHAGGIWRAPQLP